MTHHKTPRLKPLLDKVPPGFLVDTAWLKRSEGIDPKSIHEYVTRGWLERVVRGVYRRPLPRNVREPDDAAWQAPLLSLQWILGKNVHLGGESALDLAGYAHFLPLGSRRRVHVYGDVPSWLKRLPIKAEFVVHGRTLFGDDPTGIVDSSRDGQSGAQAVNVWRWPIKTSSPERAILEALDELPNDASFHTLDKVFEGLTSLRPRLLTQLLVACRSVKVRRLFFVFADRHRHAWRKHIEASEIDLGSGPRALVRGGKLHPVYRIYVPADFVPVSKAHDANG
ncbi:MAG TPA: type IV toxin-antitoxin system AbiEi family antitoxin domain-containing protein [Gammaproteobacteria bacterium]|nr:type IV toxin-antitoxin system AbiEi family antitoxin domain-containing protein [Gammaproteobacteria bacterium]